MQLRSVEEFFRAIVVEPPLARLEARDDRVISERGAFLPPLNWNIVSHLRVPWPLLRVLYTLEFH